ncbi:MAG: hypothetical protein ABIA62_06380 [Candidatus Woesearchaeota archaeon]
MCGITGIFGTKDALQRAVKGLEKVVNRGLYGFGAASDEGIILKKSIRSLSLATKPHKVI